MWSLIPALLLGLVAGAIGRALVPNDAFENLEGWRSWLVSTALGLAGALVGYWIFRAIGIGDTDKFDWGGLIGAIIGAVIVTAVVSWVFRKGTGRQTIA
jgi:uncharacterized membrane protein YeaQ/YmgE (transglycosylase-associated protein family)